jgi:hypothetical protein
MNLVFKKCGKTDIADEASNAPRGGFLCQSCYRSFQIRSLVIGIVLAIVGLFAAAGAIWPTAR